MNFLKNLFREFKIKKILSIFGVLIIGALNAAEQAPQDAALIAATQEMAINIPRGLSDPLAFNPDQPFERVITLGYNCVPKGHVNMYFNPEEKDARITKKSHADLFDWVLIHDYEKLAMAISKKMEDIFLEDELIFEKTQCKINKYSIWNKYDFQWLHLFHENIFPESSGFYESMLEEQKNTFNNLYPQLREKVDYLCLKFNEAKTKKTLYIISTPGDKVSLETLNRLYESILYSRDNNANFEILYVPQFSDKKDFAQVKIRPASIFLQLWHGGIQDQWKEILDQFKFAPNIWD
ncbi:MAG: hypothetical protein CNLJKLNK_00289 [Holosporales bacterium]